MRHFLLILITILFGCGHAPAQKRYVVTQYNDDSPKMVVYIKGSGDKQQKVKEESFFSNGNLEYVGNFKNGVENGVFLYYYEDGTLKVEEHWKNGEEDGITKEYSPDGQLDLEQHYKKGHLIEEKNYKSG